MRSCIGTAERYGARAVILLPPFDSDSAKKFLVKLKMKLGNVKTVVILKSDTDNALGSFADLCFRLPLDMTDFNRVFSSLLPPSDTGEAAVRAGRLLLTSFPYKVLVRGLPLYLTASETSIVRLLVLNPGVIMKASDIGAICFEEETRPGTVVTHIAMINKKCNTACGVPLIINDRKTGYKVNPGL